MTRSLPAFLLVLDAVVTFVVFNAVAIFRGVADFHNLVVSPLAVPFAVIALAIYLVDGYKPRTDMLSVDYTSQHAIALVAAMIAILLFTFAFQEVGPQLQSSRLVIIFGFCALVPITLGYRRALYLRRLAARGARTIIFLGDPKACEDFRRECLKLRMPHEVIYSVVNLATAPPFPVASDINLVGFGEVLGRVHRGELAVEAIVLRETSRELQPEISRGLVELYFSGVPTYTLELFHQVYWQKIPLYRLNQTWLFQEGFQIAREPVFERIKRGTDIALALATLLLASPLLLLAALAIRFEDGGPVFFTQTRIGKNHQPFRLFKLRTMRVAQTDGDLYTREGDKRITRIGKLLRASRLDEFPQVLNVLRGEMSFIGPRAEWDRLVETYEREISCYHFRHLVKPGITGWAQVNYPYGANLEDTVRKLEYDLYYIRHFSFRLDATIVLKTIHIMLFGKGR